MSGIFVAAVIATVAVIAVAVVLSRRDCAWYDEMLAGAGSWEPPAEPETKPTLTVVPVDQDEGAA